MIKYLSSMRFAFWLLIILILWFFVGVCLAASDTFYNDIKEMSNYLIFEWLKRGLDSPIILIWFIGLCVIAVLLAISFVFCSWNNLLKKALTSKKKTSIVLLLIHILFVLIMALHLGAMVFGFKHTKIELMPGDSYGFEEGYSIKLNNVNYIDDLSVLKLKYKKMRDHQTIDKFHYQSNYAAISIMQDGKLLDTGIIKMLSPYDYRNIRVTLSQFYLSKDSDEMIPGVKVNIVKDIFAEAFFVFYGIEILLILFFVVLTWRKK